MASQTQGIQQLLAAEKRAAEKVSEARKRKLDFHWFFEEIFSQYSFSGKQKRLKQAKEEAQDEIEKYRAERERQFKEFEAKVSLFLITRITFSVYSMTNYKESEISFKFQFSWCKFTWAISNILCDSHLIMHLVMQIAFCAYPDRS